MKKSKLIPGIALLILAAACAAPAQGPGGGPPPEPAPTAIDLIAEFDADGDGNLNAAELEASLEAMRPPEPPQTMNNNDRPTPPSAEDRAVTWIEQFDTDDNAMLSVTELTTAFQSRPLHGPPPGTPPGEDAPVADE